MKRLAIIASGDLGQQIAYHATQDLQYQVVGFFDDFANGVVNGIPILGMLNTIESNYKNDVFDEIIIAIGYKHFKLRASLFNTFKEKVPFANCIHSSCYVDASVKLGKGIVMFPGSVIDANVIIKDNVLLNVACTVAHDSIIADNTFLSPRVAIAGFVSVGGNCNIGINSTIIDNISIGNNIQIGGGTVIISNLEKEGLYVGNPSRFIR